MRAVLDPNVLISSALSPDGSPGRIIRHWLEGAFDLTVSPLLLDELRRALAYPKLRERITVEEADEILDLLTRGGELVDDPPAPPQVSSSDPDDDYLIALAGQSRAMLVSGDRDLLALSDQIPVCSPAEFLDLVERAP